MKLIIISGLSGSGKTVALHTLEDEDYYCVDNLPIGLLPQFVERILSRKAMDAWFSAVDGSPRAKAEIIKDHLRQFSTLPEEVVMVGDQPGDAEAAYQSGIRCILIGEPQDLDDSVTHVASFPEAAASLRAAIPAEERPSPKSLHSR